MKANLGGLTEHWVVVASLTLDTEIPDSLSKAYTMAFRKFAVQTRRAPGVVALNVYQNEASLAEFALVTRWRDLSSINGWHDSGAHRSISSFVRSLATDRVPVSMFVELYGPLWKVSEANIWPTGPVLIVREAVSDPEIEDRNPSNHGAPCLEVRRYRTVSEGRQLVLCWRPAPSRGRRRATLTKGVVGESILVQVPGGMRSSASTGSPGSIAPVLELTSTAI